MSSRISASFDALVIADRLDQTTGGVAAGELHMFAYLACLIAFYDKEHPRMWLYDFAATPAGTPYAPLLSEECDQLRASGRLGDRENVLGLTSIGRSEINALMTLRSLRRRVPYLEAACGVSTLLPVPSITEALWSDPQLVRATQPNTSRELMKPIALSLIEEQFKAIGSALTSFWPGSRDLLIPTSIWLTYLPATK